MVFCLIIKELLHITRTQAVIAPQPTYSPQKLIRFWSSDGRQKREFLSE
jgi:hypothetical protein